MITLKHLLTEFGESNIVPTISARDIYNFYFLWWIANNESNLVSTPYGKEIMEHYISKLKDKYVKCFKIIIAKQIAKYIQRGRVDPDFPKDALPTLQGKSASELQTLMAKTFRSDMRRRNDNWDMVANFLTNLEGAMDTKSKFLYINQLNNAVHNTGTQVMDKFPNYYSELRAAFDRVHRAKNPELEFKPLVDKDIRSLLSQGEGEGGPMNTFYERLMMNEGLEKILKIRKNKLT